jgi:hypothetical protein
MSHIRDYDDWNDGHDFRPSNPNFCEKCNHKGTFLKELVDEERGTTSAVCIDCPCKVEYVAKMRLKLAGIHPQYLNIDCEKEMNDKVKHFMDVFYTTYKDPNKVSHNLLLTGSDLTKKTKTLAKFSKYLLMKSINVRLKYITFLDLLVTINKVWKSDDYSQIDDLYSYDFLVIDKVEQGFPYLKQNMNAVLFNNIFETRACGSTTEIELLNLDISRFIVKEV